MIAFDEIAQWWQPGMHGSTFGGNPVSCAAALAVLDTIESDGLLASADSLGARLMAGLSAHPQVQQVRGAGLLLGVVLADGVSAAEVEQHARTSGLLVNAIGADVIRLAPPLTVSSEQVDRAMELLAAAITEVAR